MNPIQKALATADTIIAENAKLEALTAARYGTRRTYVIGLPVVITVGDDGSVTATVDLSEADEAPFESGDMYDANDKIVEISEDTRIADRESISDAVTNGSVTVS